MNRRTQQPGLNRLQYPHPCQAQKGFTLLELLVVIALIVLLASLLLPALARAKKKASDAKCLSNLRQIGIGLLQYTSDESEKFPYAPALTPTGLPRMMFVDFWSMIHPYVATNGSFFLCSLDRSVAGPFNLAVASLFKEPTNQVTIPASYVFSTGLYTELDPVNGAPWQVRQRYLLEVRYPSQKFSLSCYALAQKEIPRANNIGGSAHGEKGAMYGFVDGHSALVRFAKISPHPKVAQWAFEFSPPEWQDVP